MKPPDERDNNDIKSITLFLNELKFSSLFTKIRKHFFNEKLAKLLKGCEFLVTILYSGKAYPIRSIMIEKGEEKSGKLMLYLTGELSTSKDPKMTYDKLNELNIVPVGSLLGDLNFSKFGFDLMESDIKNKDYSINLEKGLYYQDLENDSFDDFGDLNVNLTKENYTSNKNKYFRRKYVCTKTCFVGYLTKKDISEIIELCTLKEEKEALDLIRKYHTRLKFLNVKKIA